MELVCHSHALPTHEYSPELAFKLLAIVGSAVATMVMSIAARNCARQSESITNRRRVVPIVLVTSADAKDWTCRKFKLGCSLLSSLFAVGLIFDMAATGSVRKSSALADCNHALRRPSRGMQYANLCGHGPCYHANSNRPRRGCLHQRYQVSNATEVIEPSIFRAHTAEVRPLRLAEPTPHPQTSAPRYQDRSSTENQQGCPASLLPGKAK